MSSQPDTTEIKIAGQKLSLLIEIADQVLLLLQSSLGKFNEAIARQSIPMTRRNQVLIGLWLKAGGSFECLVLDAKLKRAESAHHLKTMVEAFIYSHWVSQDQGDQRARLLSGEGYRARVVYHENLEEPNAEKYVQEWRALKDDTLRGLQKEFKEFRDRKLEGLAEDCGLDQHYKKIYRAVCEAAHMADLFTYSPPDPSGTSSFAPQDISLLRAYLCLRDGLGLACDLLHDASDALKIENDRTIEEFRQEILAIMSIK